MARAGLQLFSCSKGRCGAWQGARVSCVPVLRLPLLHPSDRGRTSAEPCAGCACPGVSLPAQGNFHGQPGQGVRLGCSERATAFSLAETAPSRACFPPQNTPIQRQGLPNADGCRCSLPCPRHSQQRGWMGTGRREGGREGDYFWHQQKISEEASCSVIRLQGRGSFASLREGLS